jgi:hypothetical protein
MANPAIVFGMMGLVYGLCHWIFYTSGVRAGSAWWGMRPAEGELVPEQAIGAMGCLAAAIGLLVMAVWHFAADPFGPLGLSSWSLMFSVVPALYGFLFLGTFFCATRGWDWRPIGDAALWGATTQFILIPFAANAGVTWDFNLGLFVYGITATTWGLLIHGKCSARIHQINLILSMITTWYYMIMGGIFVGAASTSWGNFVSDVQGTLTQDEWVWLWIIVGVVNMIMMIWTYRAGPERAFVW